MKNKKGLSAIVTTLIIILLVLVAVGIVWMVVQNLIEGGASDIEVKAKCIGVDLRPIAANCTDPDSTNCKVTLERGSDSEVLGGVKIVFYEGETGSTPIDSEGDVPALETKEITGLNVFTVDGLTTPDKVKVTVYFVDDSGTKQLCPTPSEFSF